MPETDSTMTVPARGAGRALAAPPHRHSAKSGTGRLVLPISEVSMLPTLQPTQYAIQPSDWNKPVPEARSAKRKPTADGGPFSAVGTTSEKRPLPPGYHSEYVKATAAGAMPELVSRRLGCLVHHPRSTQARTSPRFASKLKGSRELSKRVELILFVRATANLYRTLYRPQRT